MIYQGHTQETPKLNQTRVNCFFSFKRRKIENDKILWMQKVWVIERFMDSRFNDYTTLDPKFVMGNQPYSNKQWVAMYAFSSANELSKFVEKETVEREDNAHKLKLILGINET